MKLEIMELLKDILYVAITIILPIITNYLVKFFKSKAESISVSTENVAIHDTLNEVMGVIINAVISTSQTYVDSLKAEGKFDKESQVIAFNKTKENILSILSEDALEVLGVLYKDVDAWLTIQIESIVRQYKNN